MDGLKSEHVFEECGKIVKDVDTIELLSSNDMAAAAEVLFSIKNAELNGISAYIRQIMQFVGYGIKGGEAPFIATAFSIVAKNLLEFCEEIGNKDKCEELWKLCEQHLESRIAIAGKNASHKEDK